MKLNAPNMGRSASVKGTCSTVNITTAHALDVVGIDLHAQGMAMRFTGVIGTARTERFGHQDTHAAMKPAKGLHGFFLHMQPSRDEVIPHLRELEPQVIGRTAPAHGVQEFNGDGFLPNSHDQRKSKSVMSGNSPMKERSPLAELFFQLPFAHDRCREHGLRGFDADRLGCSEVLFGLFAFFVFSLLTFGHGRVPNV